MNMSNNNNDNHHIVKDEINKLIGIGLPKSITLLCRISMSITDLVFIGHLKDDSNYLSAASLALVWMTITQVVISRGINTTLTTLVAQSYGNGNDHLCGVWLQLAIVISSLCCIPVGILWYYFDSILLLFKVDHIFASTAAHFARYSIIGLLPSSIYFNFSAYFQAQGVVMPFLYVSALFVLINIFLNYIFIYGIGHYWDGLGFTGSPIATAVSRWGQVILLYLFVFIFFKMHKRTWNGWLLKEYSLTRIKEFSRMGIANLIAAGLEEYQIQLVAIFAMKLGKDNLAAHNAMLGISTATNVRVGQCLGAAQIESAKLVLKVACLRLALPVGIIVGLFFVLGRNIVGKIFTNDKHIWYLCSTISWLVGPSYFMLCFFYTSMACLDAQGRPQVVALSFLIGAWFVCIPSGYLLAFEANMDLQGLWLGLILGYAVITLIVCIAVYKSNWEELAELARIRSLPNKVKGSPSSNEDATTHLLQSPVTTSYDTYISYDMDYSDKSNIDNDKLTLD